MPVKGGVNQSTQREEFMELRSLDFDLGETAEAMRESVRSFRRRRESRRAPPTSTGTTTSPPTCGASSANLGLLGITVEEEFGGAGMGYLEHVIALEEISRASASVGLSYGAALQTCASTRSAATAPRLTSANTLPRAVSGEHVGALAMSEPGAGSDGRLDAPQGERRGDRYVLNGTKMWITTGRTPTSSWSMQDRAEAGPRALTAFIVETKDQGLPGRAEAGQSCGSAAARTPASWRQASARLRRRTCCRPEGKGVNVLMSGLDYDARSRGRPLGIMQAGDGRGRALCPRPQAVRPVDRAPSS
jgi:isovaleryl-CoA dehydrogenase